MNQHKLSATAFAPANIAIIKYWGKRDDDLNLPCQDSISVNLSALSSQCYVSWGEYARDSIIIDDVELSEKEKTRATRILDETRRLAQFQLRAQVVAKNNFQSCAGLASSASGMAALALAATRAAKLALSKETLSCLARLGSGSAARSIPDAWVRWQRGESADGSDSYAFSVFPLSHWELDIYVIKVSDEKKAVSSSEGMRICRETSPFWEQYHRCTAHEIPRALEALKERNMKKLSYIIHANAMRMHSVCLSAWPPINYLRERSWEIFRQLLELSLAGFPLACTFDAGPNPIVLCERAQSEELLSLLNKLSLPIIKSQVCEGARIKESLI